MRLKNFIQVAMFLFLIVSHLKLLLMCESRCDGIAHFALRKKAKKIQLESVFLLTKTN